MLTSLQPPLEDAVPAAERGWREVGGGFETAGVGKPVKSLGLARNSSGLHDRCNLSALELGETAPDAKRFSNIYGVIGAGLASRAHLADCLGAFFPSLTFIFALEGRWGEKEVGMIAPAQCFQLPLIRRPHRCSHRFARDCG
jgi:hypothetical protein